MVDRPRVPLELGGGLSRAGAALSIRPGRARDLRNVYTRLDEVQVRRGISLTSTLVDETGAQMSHTICLHVLRSLHLAVAVGYRQATGKVYVFRLDSLGYRPEIIPMAAADMWDNGRPQFWFALAAGSAPPSIIATDTYGKLFLAHDEELIGARQATVYYDHANQELRVLTADLGTGTVEPVKFRGVARHLDYLFGWGFGHATEDRPEFVRNSLPGEPLSWDAEDYWIVGQRDDPVLRVIPAGNLAVAFKAHEIHQLVGYDRATFAIQPLDQLVGLLSSQLVMAVHDNVFFWSASGPHVTNGGTVQPLDFELDLQGFEPSDLVAITEDAHAFGAYIPTRKAVSFFFGRRAYTLCLEAEQREWTYMELAQRPYCAAVFYDETVAAPTGYPELLAAGAGSTVGDFYIDVGVRHTGAGAGSEWIEFWVRETAGTWHRYHAERANLTVVDQTVRLEGLAPATEYQVAARYTNGNQYVAGYTGATPSDWTAAAYETGLVKKFYTTIATAFSLATPVWSRTSATAEKIALSWSGGPPNSQTDVLKSTNGTDFTQIATVAAGTSTYDYAVLTGEGETYLWFKVRPRSGGFTGTDSNIRQVWVGPPMPLNQAVEWWPQPEDATKAKIFVEWEDATGQHITEVWIKTTPAGSFYLYGDVDTDVTAFPRKQTKTTVAPLTGYVPTTTGVPLIDFLVVNQHYYNLNSNARIPILFIGKSSDPYGYIHASGVSDPSGETMYVEEPVILTAADESVVGPEQDWLMPSKVVVVSGTKVQTWYKLVRLHYRVLGEAEWNIWSPYRDVPSGWNSRYERSLARLLTNHDNSNTYRRLGTTVDVNAAAILEFGNKDDAAATVPPALANRQTPYFVECYLSRGPAYAVWDITRPAQYQIKLRHKAQVFGVTDYSPYTDTWTAEIVLDLYAIVTTRVTTNTPTLS